MFLVFSPVTQQPTEICDKDVMLGFFISNQQQKDGVARSLLLANPEWVEGGLRLVLPHTPFCTVVKSQNVNRKIVSLLKFSNLK